MGESRGIITWTSVDEGIGFVRSDADQQRHRFRLVPGARLERGTTVAFTLDEHGEARDLRAVETQVVTSPEASPPPAGGPPPAVLVPGAPPAPAADAPSVMEITVVPPARVAPLVGEQKILSPGTNGAAPSPIVDKAANVPSTLWPSVRKFGYLPDVSALRPGDVLLLSATVPVNDWLSWRMIQLTRATQIYRGYTEEHARWHHCVVYVGDYSVCEADVHKGVRYGSIFPFIGRHMIRARRVREAQHHPRIGYEIALKAMTSIGRKYAFRTVVEMGWHAFLWGVGHERFDLELRGDKEVHCSQLFANAYADAGFGNVWRKPREPVFPAELSATDKLVDVELKWIPVEPSREPAPAVVDSDLPED